MKHSFLIIVLCTLNCFIALCGVNKTLTEAQTMLQTASSIEDYTLAKKKFLSARFDVSYVESEHESAIEEGIIQCDKRINELQPHLSVNGSSSATSISFSADGGTRTLSISTNQGMPSTSYLPTWIIVTDRTASSITIKCSRNDNASSRNDWFNVDAGNRSVRINVSQSRGEEKKLVIIGSTFGNTDYDGNILTGYGEKLYASDIMYLRWKLNHNGPSVRLTKKCQIKIYDPNGTLMTGKSSPSGYTIESYMTFLPGDNNTIEMPGWGNKTKSAYGTGIYTFELWCDGNKLYSAPVELFLKEGETSNLVITGSTFGNMYDGNILTGYGEKLYASDIMYLHWKLNYNGPSVRLTKKCQIKIYDPNGTLKTGKSSPSGYTTESNITFSPGDNNAIDVIGWGNKTKSAYGAGIYTFELWCDGNKLYSAPVELFLKEEEASNMTISGSTFGNTDYDGNILTGYGEKLYASDIMYLHWKLNYNGPSVRLTKKCQIKIYDPNGTLETAKSSPSGYTSERYITFLPGDNNTIDVIGYGNKNKNAYGTGIYTFELWCDGNKLYSSSVRLLTKEASYLTVDDKTVLNVFFGREKESRVFTVSTDVETWTTWGVPYWCKIIDKDLNSFKILVEYNSSRKPRESFMEVRADGKKVRINITQAGKRGFK